MDYCYSPKNVRAVRVEELVPQQEELDGVVSMDVEQGIALFSGKVRQIELLLCRSGIKKETISVHAGDFVPCLDNYYLKLLVLARRYMSGEREALVI